MKAILKQMMSKMLSLHNTKKDEGITLKIRRGNPWGFVFMSFERSKSEMFIVRIEA